MVFPIPIAIGLAVVGVAAAGAVGAAVKKRADKKKRQRDSARQDQEQAHRPSHSNTPGPEQRRQQEPGRQRQPHDRASQSPATQIRTISEGRRPYRPQPRRLPPYDKQSLVKALDLAIANAAKDTLDAALAKPPFSRMSPDEQTDHIRRNANAMRSALRALRMPDYDDDITAASYLLEYHPQHVGLAHAIMSRALQSRNSGRMIDDTGRLHVVDLASGTLAMQFGVALTVADALIRGESVGRVSIDSVDISSAMLKAGQAAWENFAAAVEHDDNLEALAEACRLITFDTHTPHNTVPSREGECWMSCLHGVYQQNSSNLERALHALHDEHSPIIGMMSCWGRTPEDQNVEIARRISPFRGAGWRSDRVFLPMRAEYPIPFLFNREEPDAIETANIGHRYGILYNEYPGFLWRPTDTALLTYYRSSSYRVSG